MCLLTALCSLCVHCQSSDLLSLRHKRTSLFQEDTPSFYFQSVSEQFAGLLDRHLMMAIIESRYVTLRWSELGECPYQTEEQVRVARKSRSRTKLKARWLDWSETSVSRRVVENIQSLTCA